MEITYDHIEPLIIRADAEGSKMFVEFQLPDSDDTIESESPIKRLRGVKSDLNRVLRRQATNQIRRTASRAIRGALGGGLLGRTGRMVFNSVSREQSREFNQAYTKEEKEAAILAAFQKVSQHFHFDEENYMWISPPANIKAAAKTNISTQEKLKLSPFERQLHDHPIHDPFEQEILGRMVVEIAQADGHISDEEREFFESFLPESLGTMDSLIGMDPISQIECEEVNTNSKETILMLGWVISLVDMDLDPAEREMLMDFGSMFGFNQAKIDEIVKLAKFYVLEEAIDTSISREELFSIADQIDLDRADAERCLIQMKRRSR